MGDTTGNSAKRANPIRDWRPVSSSRALAGATVAALGVLTPIYLGTNADLSGVRFLLSIVLATFAVLLIVEGVNRARAAAGWRPTVAIGIIAAILSMAVVLAPFSKGNAVQGDGGLRLTMRPTAPELFRLAFREPIGWPSGREGWPQLHRRGGIDVDNSHFQLILANEGPIPISVLSIRVEVLGSEPLPHGTLAWRYSQGDEGVGKLAALIPNGRRGSIARVYESSERAFDAETLATETPYFQSRYILLNPGEVYPATLTVKAETPRAIRYKVIVEGESANRRFVLHSPVYRLVGSFEDSYQTQFARYYSKGHDPHACTPTPNNPWVDARNTDRFSACPNGLGSMYEVQPPSSSKFPPGELRLNLNVTSGRQSASIDGVVVGAAPTAVARADVVRPLLSSLGAWDRCTEYLPSTGYWTARWERLGLRLTFISEGRDDCTAASPARVREIEIAEKSVRVATDLGPIETEAPAEDVPGALQRLLTVEETTEYDRVLVAPGGSVCNPAKPDLSRFQVAESLPGGILALNEPLSSGTISGLTVTLPPTEC
jgi:hypothetical protein